MICCGTRRILKSLCNINWPCRVYYNVNLGKVTILFTMCSAFTGRWHLIVKVVLIPLKSMYNQMKFARTVLKFSRTVKIKILHIYKQTSNDKNNDIIYVHIRTLCEIKNKKTILWCSVVYHCKVQRLVKRWRKFIWMKFIYQHFGEIWPFEQAEIN